MPHDATNMPFARSAAFREGHQIQQEHSSGEKLDLTLSLENILLEEFNYASLTAYQSMEDRARVSNLYYVLLGTLVTGLVAIYQFSGPARGYTLPLFIILLLIAGIMSFTFFLKIIRLRQAHRDSLICMNMIKEFYILQFQQQMPQIQHVFRWRLRSIPAGERFGSVTFVMSYLIALLGSICFASVALLVLLPGIVTNSSNLLPIWAGILVAIAFGVFVLALHIAYYRYSLSRSKEQKVINKIESEMGLSLSSTSL